MVTKRIVKNLSDAAAILKNGGLVAVPTETVYGLAGNGLDHDAVSMIYEVKGRPAIKPLSLMVPDETAMERYCLDVPRQAYTLARYFWPGPLTIVLKAKDSIPAIVLAGGKTVGLRCPDHPMTLSLLRECGLPLAAPSANPSGAPSPKSADEVLAYFDGRIAAVIDGGPCGIGKESTLIDLSEAPFRILRQGALSEDAIADALAKEMDVVGITGGSGCGKTTVLYELKARGAMILDCDEIYHELLASCREMLAELEDAFPGALHDGCVDRAALGAMVFAAPEKLSLLNRITHKYVLREVDRRLREHAMSGGKLAAIDAVELFSSGIAARCGVVVGVLADQEKRIERIMARDGISREKAEKRVRAQRPDDYYIQNCDRVVYNNADRQSVHRLCSQLFKEILKHG